MTRTINEWEAQRLLRIADLCEHECMIALPPSEAAQSAGAAAGGAVDGVVAVGHDVEGAGDGAVYQ